MLFSDNQPSNDKQPFLLFNNTNADENKETVLADKPKAGAIINKDTRFENTEKVVKKKKKELTLRNI